MVEAVIRPLPWKGRDSDTAAYLSVPLWSAAAISIDPRYVEGTVLLARSGSGTVCGLFQEHAQLPGGVWG